MPYNLPTNLTRDSAGPAGIANSANAAINAIDARVAAMETGNASRKSTLSALVAVNPAGYTRTRNIIQDPDGLGPGWNLFVSAPSVASKVSGTVDGLPASGWSASVGGGQITLQGPALPAHEAGNGFIAVRVQSSVSQTIRYQVDVKTTSGSNLGSPSATANLVAGTPTTISGAVGFSSAWDKAVVNITATSASAGTVLFNQATAHVGPAPVTISGNADNGYFTLAVNASDNIGVKVV
ncbi:hypothetical protein NCPPB3778_28 [Rathayibacter phage NCPPB3778]|nr:hypothetical protein NCPPB3778_28 [Rathayibacter phage NCPPB3778]